MAVSLDTETAYMLEYGSSATLNLRVNETQFGDGYKQSVQDGINTDEESWSLTFLPIETASSITLVGLLKQSKNGTANVLSWTPPGESTAKYYEASDITRKPISYTLWQVGCTLTRVFPII